MARIAPQGSGSAVPALASASPRSFSNAWRELFVPVEWGGTYSVDKVLGLLAYDASRTRVWLMLVLTPLPALAVCLLIEFLLPLNDPALGLRGNIMFLVRTWVRTWPASFAVDWCLEFYNPVLRLPRLRLFPMNVVQGFVAGAAIAVVSQAASVFPIPFTPATTMPIYAIFSWLLRFLCDRSLRQRDPDPAETRRAMGRAMKSTNFGVLLIYIYCGFVTLLALTPTHWQAPLALTLVGIKSFATRGDWQRAQQLLASGQNDLATAHVSFGAQYFHALFVAACLQQSSSLEMLATIVAITLVYQLTTIHELQRHTERVARLATQLGNSAGTTPRQRLREIASRWQRHRSTLDASVVTAPFPAATWLGRPAGEECDSGQGSTKMFEPLSPEEREYLEAASVLFQCREATLLRMYVDIFVPVVFYAFVATIKYLPNGAFMPLLRTNDLGELAMRLGVQLIFKLVVFALLQYTLKDNADDPSGLRQLSFALERMAPIVHAKSLFVTLCVFDFTLLHNGNDLTFQFAWLYDRPETVVSGL